jgi:hypothetical protein
MQAAVTQPVRDGQHVKGGITRRLAPHHKRHRQIALALVTTGPSITTCFGILPGPIPVFSPDTIAATPAMIAPP